MKILRKSTTAVAKKTTEAKVNNMKVTHKPVPDSHLLLLIN